MNDIARWVLWAGVCVAVGCGIAAEPVQDAGMTTSEGEASSGAPGPGVATGAATSTSTSGTSGTSGASCGSESGPWSCVEESSWRSCSPLLGDCPEGEKCTPYSLDGDDSWDGAWCVEVVPDAGGFGDPCTNFEGPQSGIDSCGDGLVCWRPSGVEAPEGECVAFCAGWDELCPPDSQCVPADGTNFGVCIPDPNECDVAAQDCPSGQKCMPYAKWDPWWDATKCMPIDPNPDALGETCTRFEGKYSGLDTCDEGLICWRPYDAPEDVCVAFCSGSGDDCPGIVTCKPQSVAEYGLCTLTQYDCDLWAQDCPSGHKCNAYQSVSGNSWDAVKCFPIEETPDGLGEPCTVVDHNASGVDSCDEGLICWDVDPDTLEGVCIGYCQGTLEEPTCEDPTAWCAVGSDGVLAICLPGCDPLLQDCKIGQGCYAAHETFLCAPDASGDSGVAGDPCQYINVCDPGLFCTASTGVPGCTDSWCCSPFCDITLDAATQCMEGQECVPWYYASTPPPAYANVGGCLLPESP